MAAAEESMSPMSVVETQMLESLLEPGDEGVQRTYVGDGLAPFFVIGLEQDDDTIKMISHPVCGDIDILISVTRDMLSFEGALKPYWLSMPPYARQLHLENNYNQIWLACRNALMDDLNHVCMGVFEPLEPTQAFDNDGGDQFPYVPHSPDNDPPELPSAPSNKLQRTESMRPPAWRL